MYYREYSTLEIYLLKIEASRRRGRVFYYHAACMLVLVSHIGDSGVAGKELRSSRRLSFALYCHFL